MVQHINYRWSAPESRTGWLRWLVIFILCAGCGEPTIFVTLAPPPADVARVWIRSIWNELQGLDQPVDPGQQQVKVVLPDAASGLLRLEVLGVDSNGCTVATAPPVTGEIPRGLRRFREASFSLVPELVGHYQDGWCKQLTPQKKAYTLQSIFGLSADDLWVVGSEGSIFHFYDSMWTAYPAGTASWLYSVWGSGPGDVWAVGAAGGIVHWDGGQWIPRGVSGPQGLSLYGIRGTAPNDIWAVGDQGAIWHWDGQWSLSDSRTTERLYGVWASGKNDAWAVGADGTILSWNGARWAAMKTPTTSDLRAIWWGDAKNVWVAGAQGTVLHWDGTSWETSPTGTDTSFTGIFGTTAGDVWAVGEAGLVWHWNGTSWSHADNSLGAALYGVWGSGGKEVWAVGQNTLILHKGD